MTQEQKLNELAEWLEAHGINYYEPLKYNDPAHISYYDRGVRIIIPQKQIAIVVCKAKDEDSVYEVLKQNSIKAFFIRENEDLDLIIEKIQNCLKGWTVAKAQREKAKAGKNNSHAVAITHPRKRTRIHVKPVRVIEKVNFIKKPKHNGSED